MTKREPFDNKHDGIRVLLEDTEHGPALTVEWWEEDILPDEPRSGSTVYLSDEQVAGMAAWLTSSVKMGAKAPLYTVAELHEKLSEVEWADEESRWLRDELLSYLANDRQLERENERLRAVLREVAFDAERLCHPSEITDKARKASA